MEYNILSILKYRQIIRCFCADITATVCSEIVRVNRNTVNTGTMSSGTRQDISGCDCRNES